MGLVVFCIILSIILLFCYLHMKSQISKILKIHNFEDAAYEKLDLKTNVAEIKLKLDLYLKNNKDNEEIDFKQYDLNNMIKKTKIQK